MNRLMFIILCMLLICFLSLPNVETYQVQYPCCDESFPCPFTGEVCLNGRCTKTRDI